MTVDSHDIILDHSIIRYIKLASDVRTHDHEVRQSNKMNKDALRAALIDTKLKNHRPDSLMSTSTNIITFPISSLQ